MIQQTTKEELFGLNVLRALAILLVLIEHSVFLVPDLKSIDLHLNGVSVFFVLSGFLIGTRAFISLTAGSFSFKQFLVHRITKTFPSYFAVLFFIYFYFLFTNQNLHDFGLNFFFFTQNLVGNELEFFPESWSLAVEEWFYFSFFLLLALYVKVIQLNRNSFLFLTSIVTLVKIGFSVFLLAQFDHLAPEKSVVFQIDYLFVGLVFGFLSERVPSFWIQLKLPALLVSIISLFLFEIFKPTDYWTQFVVEIVIIACALPYLSLIQTNQKGFFQRVVTYIAHRSYSIYLVNLSIAQVIFLPVIFKYLVPNTSAIILILIYLIVVFSSSSILFHLVETKGVRLRKRFLNK